ncbi:MAG TPA: MFS transporter [Acidobacteriaceae bacterium]|jgi:ACS family tartrate transporter-like MFS transporter
MDADAGRSPLESALRKARWRILPLLSLGYLAAFTDRVNISFAAESMNRDLHFSPSVYGLGAGLFFVSYALCEVPSNWLLLRFGARRWLARIMFTWGVLAIAMLFVHSRTSFYGMRLLLGVAEAGYFPGAVYYLSLWFPAKERARAISFFYVSLPLASVFMGSAAGALLRLDGRLGLKGWQWLFLVEGIPAVLLSAAIWTTLAEKPGTAKWLCEGEREALERELAEAGLSVEHSGGWNALRAVLSDARVWMLGLCALCLLGSHYAYNFFLPELLRGLTGVSPGTAGYLIAIAAAVGAAAMIVNGIHSDRRHERRWHVIVPALAMALLMLFAGLHLRGWTAAIVLLVSMPVFYVMQAPWVAIVAELFQGEKAALAIATINMLGIIGGFVGPYWMGWMREQTGTYAAGLSWLCVPWLVMAAALGWAIRRTAVNVTSGDKNVVKIAPEPAN